MEHNDAQHAVEALSSRGDWTLMAARWLMGWGSFFLNRLSPPAPEIQEAAEWLLIFYLGLTLLEALFLWQRWGQQVWPQVTLILDLLLVLTLLFLAGPSRDSLMPLLLLPVVAVSMRLGFSSGLSLHLAAWAGYIFLVVVGYPDRGPQADLLELGLFGAALVVVAVFGGLVVEQRSGLSRREIRRYEEQIRQTKRQYAAAGERARVFYEMSHTLSVTMNYQKVLEGILRQCQRLLDSSVGVVLLSAGEEDVYVAAFSGLRVGDWGEEIRLCGGELSVSMAAGEPTILKHLGGDPEFSQVLALKRCRSGMSVPLRAGLRNYGAIVLGSVREGAYSQDDLDQLTALAHFATIAIQNAQLYQDLREERDKIIRAEEDVRKELSRDLHDGPAQALAAITMSLEYVKRLLDGDPAKSLEELDVLEQLARKTSWDIRTMLFELRPIILETQGLVPTLKQYARRFSGSEGARVHLDTGGFDQRLDPNAENTIFTILQEAVNNARKHAKASNIWLRLARDGDELIASVQDDGVGFNLEAVQASYDQRGSFGLLNMQERAERIGGRTEIHSAPGKGTAVIISVPLKGE